jgi:hypothetical protein
MAVPATSSADNFPCERLDIHDHVRTDRVHKTGTITLRAASRLHHIGIGIGVLLRELTLDPTKDCQPRGVPCGRPKKKL